MVRQNYKNKKHANNSSHGIYSSCKLSYTSYHENFLECNENRKGQPTKIRNSIKNNRCTGDKDNVAKTQGKVN